MPTIDEIFIFKKISYVNMHATAWISYSERIYERKTCLQKWNTDNFTAIKWFTICLIKSIVLKKAKTLPQVCQAKWIILLVFKEVNSVILLVWVFSMRSQIVINEVLRI